MRVLLYSHHSRNGEIDEYVTRSLENIAHNFDSIYFLTNAVDPIIGVDKATPVFFDSRNDFESYTGFFSRSPEVVSGASMLYLVNDSILIQASVHLPRSPRIDVFGPVESRQQGTHIQSYFIGFHNQETIDMVVDYLERFPGSFADKQAVIDYCETGLSRYLIERRRRRHAWFTPPDGFVYEPTRTYWKTLLQEIGILKRNVLLGTGDYDLDAMSFDELVESCHDDEWKSIVSRLHVPRSGTAHHSGTAARAELDDVLDEVYGRILLRPCDPSGRETYSRFLGSHTLAELEQVLRQSPEYRELQDIATAYREVLGRYPDGHGAHAYRNELREEEGVERIKAMLAESAEYRHHVDGTADYRRLCRRYAQRFDDYATSWTGTDRSKPC